MSVARFLNYIQYSTECPSGLSPARWAGMLSWYYSMLDYQDDCELWAEQHVGV